MSHIEMSWRQLPPEQEAIRAKCFGPTGIYVEFPIEDVETSIPARFEKIVRRYADRIAVKTETRVATYSQLNDMANRFARALLQSQGPKAQLVAVLLEKDVAQVAAMLGAMKAGKFFLILDPSFPKNRLATMLTGSRAKLVVTNRRNAFLADEIAAPDCELMPWETIDESISGDNPEISIAPKALAFINYTSGSTGEPKGLLRTHRMILHNIMLRTNLIHVCEHDRISLLSSGTSNAITNSFLALLNGAGLYSLEVKKEGVVRLAHWLADENITIAPMSSPLFRGLCETLNGNTNFPELRVIRLRSESVYKSDADLYKQFFSPKCIFVTGLSSNETGPLADYLIDHDTVVTDGAVPVGYAAPDKELVLLNQDGEKIGFNEIGEIVVRSRYLSPGYLRNPRLAKGKFKRDPSAPGNRIYLTGDMGLMLSDGCLIHKGRKDFRVKIRGYPVDLKEVETALRAHPGVHDSVVTARANRAGETVLVAYFVTASKQAPNVSELIRFLRQTLPDYMIPAAFVRLSSMPLNPQNKVDRAALPPPAETRPDLDTPFMAPRGDEEREVAEIWAEVLGIDRVGIHDNFFELGGHSLAATRIVTRVTEKFHLDLPLQALFESPTVEEMAAVIREHQSIDYQPGELRSQPSSDAVRARLVGPTIDFKPFPREDVERSVPERFEKMVRMYPDRIAVQTGNEAITYSQLNAMANRMAHAIVERRGSEAEAIAILLDKGPKLMAAMLAVLKAGKFFVLLDSSSPQSRLAVILEDSQATLIISNRHEYDALLDENVTTPSLLEFDAIPAESSEKNPCLSISPQSLAGVFYTSGSTGEPKGVIWTHRNLLHQTMLFADAYKLSERDRLLLTTSGTANALTIGFLALVTGAALLPFDVQSHGVGMLIRWIVEEKITICWMGSPLFRNMCRAVTGKRVFSDVRILRLSSEASFKSDIELYKRHFPPECLLINGLSNTEAGLICLYRVDFETKILGQDVPVGYPVEDKEILLLDDSGKEVGFHEVGEIAIRSRYLSPGYWRRPELTAIKFKPDPDNGDQRIYLSGDLGIRLPDGCLIYKGRKDFRVKIRGYGVELAEVEKVLASHASVRQAVVVPRKTETGEARLVAYFTRTDLPASTVSELRGFLKTRLPEFMIPSAFVMLETIPLTHSGKIDRRALPEPDKLRPDLTTAYLSPRNDIEQKLVSIWEDVLDVRPVGVNDGFFDLGGDSLSATRIISQVIKHFQVEIPLQSLFQSPTISDMAAVVAQRQGKRSGNEKVVHAAEASLVHTAREGFSPLSYSQQRLWFLDQLDPSSFAYNLFSAYRLKGGLNVAALEQSFNEILRRHEVLRTLFKSEKGQPVQVVLPNLTIRIPLFDLRGILSEEKRWAEVHRICREEAQRPFDLATGPLLRITLIRLTDDEDVLLRATHHIVSDGWSEGVLFHELSEIYAALSIGKPSPLPDLSTQYADYAKWQRQGFEGERLEFQLSYWKKQLESIEILKLPTDRPRRALGTSRGARQYFTLSPTLSSELKELGQQRGATLFMTLLAAFQTLLHRYSGQTDIVVGSPVAGRSRKEFEELIGFFLNMLVLRLDLSGNPTFAEVIGRARRICLEALSHQQVPFDKLVEELHPDRNLGHNPLFQVSFAFQNTPRFLPQLSDIKIDELEVETGIARFDLHLFMEEVDGHLKGYCVYDTDLFNGDTIERLLGHFQTLLESVVANPEQRVSDIPILTETEKHQLLTEWNGKREYRKDKCIHELFEEQVERTPDAVAVVFEGRQLTYRELNSRANQLAHYLRKHGVGPETLVGICVERSLELVLAILGILKAGGAYVPLDPQYPKERLVFMLEDAQARVLITQVQLAEKLGVHAVRVVCLDQDWQDIARQSQDNLQSFTAPDNLVYVIYTSGSTGVPKGTLISHHNVLRLLYATQPSFHFSPKDVWTQFHSYAFDFSVWEIWGALLHGGRLVIVPFEVSRSPREFYELLCQEQVTVLNQTPSAFRQLMLAEESIIDSSRLRLRLIIFGGEVLDFQSLKPWFDRHGDRRPQLINMYGITETTVHVTCRVIKETDLSGGVSSLIGVPIPDLELCVLDSCRNLVPVGVPGELYIGGAGLARGYLNRGDLTAERFVGHPYDDGNGRRLYRSGDLVRRRADGDIEYLGRIDNQVKIRGHRIELGEIETMLGQHSAIQQSVVLAREDCPGDRRLVAYAVASAGANPSPQDLRGFLQHKLPDYMVPSAFVFLKSLPLTPNGKLERKSLPAPDHRRPELVDAFAAPTTPVEELLANIWADVLNLDKVGVHDNFFELGGHSLLATQVISRIRDCFKLELPLRSLFETPTIAGIAERIDSTRGGKAQIRTMPIFSESTLNEYPVSFSQERFWFLEQFQPNNPAYKVTYAFQLVGPLNIAALEQSITEIVRRHESLRTTFHESRGALFQRICEQWSFHLNVINEQQDKSVDLQTNVQKLLEQECRRPFDLSTNLLLRASLLRLRYCEHILLISSHHLAWDHWSIGLFFRELSALYHAFTAGKPSPLAELPIQYKHYALWQRKILQGKEFEHYLAYWKKQLANAPASMNLPTDHPRQPLDHRRGGRQTLMLSKDLKSSLDSLSKKTGATSFMVFLAAFQTLLHRMTGDEDIVVGTPVAGRDRSETEGLIGLFLNSLAIRTNLSGDPSFLDLLARVRKVALEAYDHQELPFEKLVEELQPERNLASTPIFQVFINMYNFKEGNFQLDGLSVSSVMTPIEPAPQFDLAFYIREHDYGTRLSFVYDSDLFEAATIERTLGHFQTLIEGIIANPEQRISELPLLTEAEKQQLLVEWNDTNRGYPKDKCIHELFEAQVEKTPDAIAVVFEKQQLTYRELNTRANQLAHYLKKHGVGPEVLVGICIERSIEMIVGLLAILKAGGVYLPLDPDYPKERLSFMLEDAQVRVVLTQQQFLSSINHQRVVCLDSDLHKITTQSTNNPQSNVTADNLAYVIYTSGSTGKPKGVMIQHGSVVNFLDSMAREPGLSETDTLLAVTTLSFDIAGLEIYLPITVGARVVLACRAVAADGLRLAKQLSDCGATVMQATPATWRMLLANGWQGSRELKILCGGEALSEHLARQLVQRCASLWNMYGPTETTIWSAVRKVAANVDRVTLGRPIANTQIYILNKHINPVPIGVPGELHIGGDGLARGYLNRTEVTQEKFIANPFSERPNARLYKTGDLARYLPDGSIEFLRRVDDQVKIRGYRIELGEIEAVLGQDPTVQSSLVVVREDTPGDKRIVGYAVARPEGSFDAMEVRKHLKQKLPEYMIPSALVRVDALPLTPNGKVDRNALPTPDRSRAETGRSYAAPRTPVEEFLTGIWTEVLRVDKVGVDDNFFELGGHSLLATQIVSRIRSAFSIELPLRRLFESPTVSEMAVIITESQAKRASEAELAEILREVEASTEEEAQKILAK
jgi:amino acid adenylation domain-containing protein